MDKTNIEWTDATWNCLRGCTKVSSGCKNCYAETMAARFSWPSREDFVGGSDLEGNAGGPYEEVITNGHWNGKIKFIESKLDQPLRWKKPRKIFVNSMSDLFHEGVEDAWLREIWGIMASATRHTFQILTKRPKRMRDTIKRLGLAVWPNVWLGVSVEDQKTADERIRYLINTPAAVRWISAEPLLGPLTLQGKVGGIEVCWLKNYMEKKPHYGTLDWVVVGGESGPKSRPMHPDWVRSIRDQCRAAKIPFLFKQFGNWSPGHCIDRINWYWNAEGKESSYRGDKIKYWNDRNMSFNVGKKKAGRILDGKEWLQYPNKQ